MRSVSFEPRAGRVSPRQIHRQNNQKILRVASTARAARLEIRTGRLACVASHKGARSASIVRRASDNASEMQSCWLDNTTTLRVAHCPCQLLGFARLSRHFAFLVLIRGA